MSKEKYKEAKKFVLQNCYDYVYKSSNGEFYKEPLFESEVCPFAFKSYLKYPFFNPVNKSGYNIFYYWQLYRNGKKGPYTDKDKEELLKCKYIKVLDENTDEKDVENIDEINLNNIGCRRQKPTMKGCFFSRDNIKGKKQNEILSESIDLSADIITSLESTIKKLIDNLYKKSESNLKLQHSYFSTEIFVPAIKIEEALKKFSFVVGTIGNMMPIPEGSNPGGCGENYYNKINMWRDIFANNIEDSTKKKIRIKFLKEANYLNKDNIDSDEEPFNKFIEDFCLQDYFIDGNYKKILIPCKKIDEKKPAYPSIKATIDDWIDWFSCNTCLILKRGARIYIEGCGEKDNEKKNKARKELAWKLIEKEFNLGTWYQNEGEELGLEVLV